MGPSQSCRSQATISSQMENSWWSRQPDTVYCWCLVQHLPLHWTHFGLENHFFGGEASLLLQVFSKAILRPLSETIEDNLQQVSSPDKHNQKLVNEKQEVPHHNWSLRDVLGAWWAFYGPMQIECRWRLKDCLSREIDKKRGMETWRVLTSI